ncbi:RING finger protein, putative [Perkinsus marinus ATCC 50983]|uniref:RING-type E3 ubiquitin transferase n=1 Tax=Perkinsus marinus (strain ATCC 50983 / TXsc) TaxID=423536 RepID=C5KR88_PERM5|nr:RING finger protein, putative [Perkinsus marinus ATCC 50983]EER12989.1 RING finger protein, putative [Perkinsus marinus ATCC 50983]|eukprot:XP_002781194.1 RING finger protein, putative [Perkinsus marinus ATCC 50983]
MATRPPRLSYFCHSCGHRGTSAVCRYCGGMDKTTVTDIPPTMDYDYVDDDDEEEEEDDDDLEDFMGSPQGSRPLMVESVTVMPAPSGRFVMAPNIIEEEPGSDGDDIPSVHAGRRSGSVKGSGKAVCSAMLESLERERVHISPADYEVLREDLAMDGGRYCAICADEDDDPDPFTDLPCGHEFHLDCVKLWLTNNACCPLCRFELPQTDVDYYRMVGDDLMVRLLEQQQHHYEIREESKRRQHARKVHLALLRGCPLHVGLN